MLTLYDNWISGNGYKIRLLFAQLGVSYRRVQLDSAHGETRTKEFLAKNPNGKVPLLEFDDGRLLPESGAILWHFAEGTPLLPSDPFERAQALSWMFFEQYSHEPYIAVLRNWTHHERLEEMAAVVPQKRQDGEFALSVMEGHLNRRPFFAGERYSIADIALYAYTHVADEGGFDLSAYPAILRWLAAVKSEPGHVRLTDAMPA